LRRPSPLFVTIFFHESGSARIHGLVWRAGNIPNNIGRAFRGGQCLNSLCFQAQGLFPIEGAEAVEKQLADTGERNGVVARDAFQGDLLHQVSQKAIDRAGVTEIADTGEKFGGGKLAPALSLETALSVVGAEVRLDAHDQHAASPTLCVDVTAKGGFLLVFGVAIQPQRGRSTAQDRRQDLAAPHPRLNLKEWLSGPPPPLVFCKSVISLEFLCIFVQEYQSKDIRGNRQVAGSCGRENRLAWRRGIARTDEGLGTRAGKAEYSHTVFYQQSKEGLQRSLAHAVRCSIVVLPRE